MDTTPVASAAEASVSNEKKHFVSIRIETAEVPNLNRVMATAAKLGEVKSVNYDSYDY